MKKDKVAGLLARVPARKVYEAMLWASTSGLGMNNTGMEANGESRVLREWIRKTRDRKAMIFDVGGDQGQFYKVATEHPNRVIHVFEPHPDNNAKIVSMSSEGDHVWRAALGSDRGKAQLWVGHGEASMFKAAVTHVNSEPVPHDVQVTSLDFFCFEHGIQTVDYLRVNVEGYERSVFEGAKRAIGRGIDMVHFTLNAKSMLGGFSVAAAMELLPGYHFYRVLPNRLMRLDKWSPSTEVFRSQTIIASLQNRDDL